jgi:hypothetical protein
MRKGSACVEAFRDITHLVANFFGDPRPCPKIKGGQVQPGYRGSGHRNAAAEVPCREQRAAFCPRTSKKAVEKTTQKPSISGTTTLGHS